MSCDALLKQEASLCPVDNKGKRLVPRMLLYPWDGGNKSVREILQGKSNKTKFAWSGQCVETMETRSFYP